MERGLRLGAPWAAAVETRPLPARPAAPPGSGVECPGRREESGGAVLEGGVVPGPPKLCPPADGCGRHCLRGTVGSPHSAERGFSGA